VSNSMIIRILGGDGQYRVGGDSLQQVQLLDDQLLHAIEANDQSRALELLQEMEEFIKSAEHGTRLPDDSLETSDCTLPYPDASFAELKQLVRADGLVPGVPD